MKLQCTNEKCRAELPDEVVYVAPVAGSKTLKNENQSSVGTVKGVFISSPTKNGVSLRRPCSMVKTVSLTVKRYLVQTLKRNVTLLHSFPFSQRIAPVNATQLQAYICHSDEACTRSKQGQAGADWPHIRRNVEVLSIR